MSYSHHGGYHSGIAHKVCVTTRSGHKCGKVITGYFSRGSHFRVRRGKRRKRR